MATVRDFIKENLSYILSQEDTTELIKRKRSQFYSRYHLSTKHYFNHKEIATNTAKYLIKLGRIKTIEQLDDFFSGGYIKKYLKGVDKDILKEQIGKTPEMVLSAEQLSHLSQGEYLNRLEKEFKEKATTKALKSLEEEKKKIESIKEQVEKDIASLEKFQTELDEMPREVDIESLVEKVATEYTDEKLVEKEQLYWWDRLGLESNPFPTTMGLFRIPEDKYEDIIVTTSTVINYVKMFTSYPHEIFGKTIVLSGQFGSGKTTIFQYLLHKIIQTKSFPFFIILEPTNDWELIRDDLYKELYEKIANALKIKGYIDPRSEGIAINKIIISSLMKTLCDVYSTKGIVLFIDGLHKGDLTVESSLEFIKQLQNFHEYIETSEINMGIVIAGSPLWHRKLRSDSSYSGSYHRIDEIPPITFDEAYALLQTRINSFRLNDDIPIYFDKDAIEFSYNQIKSQKEGNITFRDFIQYLLPRLQSGQFEEAGISVDMDMEALEKIDPTLKKSIIGDQYIIYRKLTKGKAILLAACTRILQKIYNEKHIKETEKIFKKNRGAFWTLRKAKLIEKVLAADRKYFAWSLSRDMLIALSKLNEAGIPPKVVFNVFGMDIEKERGLSKKEKDEIIIVAEKILETWSSEWPDIVDNIDSFLESHKKISEGFNLEESTLLQYSKEALSDLILAVQKASETKISEEDWATNTWLEIPAPESIEYVIKKDEIKEDEKSIFLQSYCQAAGIVLDSLKDLLKVTSIVNISSKNLGHKEKKLLYNTAKKFVEGDLKGAIDTMCSALEYLVRISFYLTLSLHAGGRPYRALPDGLKNTIDQNRKKRSHLVPTTDKDNPLFLLNRNEYSQIIQYADNWKKIFEPVFKPLKKDDVIEAFDILFSLDSRSLHRDEPKVFRQTKEFIRESIVNTSWILECIGKMFDLSINSPGFVVNKDNDKLIFKISFVDDKTSQSSSPIYLKKLEGKYIYDNLQKRLTLDLSDTSGIIARYNTSLPILCAIMNYVDRAEEYKFEKTKKNISHYKIIKINNGKNK